jgi:prepilin-type N-terminal cleavage/methylation domain-containing protein
MTAMHLRDNRGVTLNELMIVLAIIAITSAIMLPMYIANLPGMRLEGASRDMLVDLPLARSLAVANNTAFLVCFDTATSYTIAREDGDPTDCSQVEKAVDLTLDYTGVEIGVGAVGSACPDAPSVDPVSFPGGVARFGARGTSTDGAGNIFTQAAVYLTNTTDSDEETYCIQVEGTTGRGRLYKWDPGTAQWR